MKFGLFCMVQSYLQAMSLVQREKAAWSGKGELIGRGFDSGDLEGSQKQRVPMTAERKNMIQVRRHSVIWLGGLRIRWKVWCRFST